MIFGMLDPSVRTGAAAGGVPDMPGMPGMKH